MSSIVVVLPQADKDIDTLADHISIDSPQAAKRFVKATWDEMGLLAGMPEIGGRCDFPSSATANLRVWSVPKFKNHLIFYRPIENGIEVVRVLHGARDLESLLDS